MKKDWGIAAVILLLCALIFFFQARPTTRSHGPASVPNTSSQLSPNTPAKAAATAASPASTDSHSAEAGSPVTNLAANAGELIVETNTASELPPETVLRNVRRAVRQYGDMFGGNPVGDNSEIT